MNTNMNICIFCTFKSNKTIKDGDIAPWPIWNNLCTWPYGKIWAKRKENITEKDWTIEIGRFLFLPLAFAPSALRPYVCKMCIFLRCLKYLWPFWELGPPWTILDHPEPFQTTLDHFKLPCTISNYLGPFQITLDYLRPWPPTNLPWPPMELPWPPTYLPWSPTDLPWPSTYIP